MGNILHISFMLSICIAPISTSKDKNEINSFKQKITLRKCILVLGLDHHCYVNRELVHVIMPALNTSAIIAHCNELVHPMGRLQAHQWDSQSRTTGALRTCSNPANVPGTRASIVVRIYHAVRSTPFASDLAFSCMGPKMKSFPLEALV